MKIIGAHSVFPRHLERTSLTSLLQFDCFRPKETNDSIVLVDYAKEACDKVLENANINASAINMIISISISPDRIAVNKDVAAPRLCHPLQRAIKAENAFVFDLIDVDWAMAIDVAKGYATNLGYKYILIIRAEICHHSILPDATSGFDVPDGAGVILLEQDESLRNVYGMYSEISDQQSAGVTFLDAVTLSQGRSKALLKWPYSETLASSLNNCRNSLINDFDSAYPFVVKGNIHESWYPGHVEEIKNGTQQLLYTNADLQFEHLGPFALPYFSRHILNNKSKKEENLYRIISFNPFLLRYGIQLISF